MGHTIGLLMLVLLGTPSWTKTAETLARSLVFITTADSSCTGMVINAAVKGDKDYILTAAHCHQTGKEIYAESVATRVIFKDVRYDVAVLEVDDLDKPAVTFAAKNPQTGDEVGSLGFGGGLEQPMLRIAHVSHAAIAIPDVDGGPFVMIDAGFVGGMSGGAVVNPAGEVVAIVQRASDKVGVGIGVDAIRKKIGRFLPKTP
mgnify:CR=1 FL=1